MIDHDLPNEAGITALADVAGLARDRAKQVLDTAGIRRDKYKKYNTDRALTALLAFKDASRSTGHALNGLGNPDAPQDHLQALAAARATAEEARARKLTLEVAAKEGKLIARADVETAAVNFATILRNSLMGLPAKICTRLVGRDADEIERILDDAIRDALSHASDYDNFILGIDPP